MPGRTPDELVAEARKLEADAISVGEDDPPGRELRAQAAELRRQALGDRIYPVVICSSCFRVTGWVAADGRCDACLRRAQLEAAYTDPHGGWVSLPDIREPEPEPPAMPFGARLEALVGLRSHLERAEAAAWLKRVDPDQSGPIEPEDGYEMEGAERDEIEAVDGSGILIRFWVATQRFHDGTWRKLDSSKAVDADLLVPGEFSAGLPIEQLAEAWTDYEVAVDTFNRAAWAQVSQAREAQRQARNAHEELLREQRGVSQLLDDES